MEIFTFLGGAGPVFRIDRKIVLAITAVDKFSLYGTCTSRRIM